MIELPKLKKVNSGPKKKKILLLSDDMRVHSGIGTMSREIVLQTANEFDWVQLGAAINHPDAGKIIDVSQELAKIGIENPSVKIYPWNGYGDPNILRELINREQPDAILHFTDPRFWGWLYHMESELRKMIPIFYYTIWDDVPYPMYNRPYYQSCDLLMCISKQTHNIVKQVLREDNYEDWQITYVPHGIDDKKYFPITKDSVQYEDYMKFANQLLKGKQYDFILFYNSRNIRRKHTSDIILAYNEFVKKLPKAKQDKVLLLMHTDPVDENGTDLPAVIEALCPDVNIQFTNIRPATEQQINFMYNLSDVTINLSSNEGFGLGTAESVMTGTPIIVNVTGGLQDQCGFKKPNGEYITEKDFNDEFQTNATGMYKNHGPWCTPIFPKLRTLQGSVPTPYIFDDMADYLDAAEAIMDWYEKTAEQRLEAGLAGREYFLSEQSGLSAKEMGKRFIKDMNAAFANWKPRTNVELLKF